MARQTGGLLGLHYPHGLWNFRRFNNRRLKTLHVVGCYNTVVLAFLTAGKDRVFAENGLIVLAICAVSVFMAIVGLAVEMPGLACYFEKLASFPGQQSCRDRYGIRTLADLRSGGKLPVHRTGITFYVLLIILWTGFLLANLSRNTF